MKRKPVTLVLCCLCLIVLTGTYFALRHNNEVAEQEAADQDTTEPILSVDPDDIQSVSFLIDGSDNTFDKAGDVWTLAEDQDFPVDPEPIQNLLEHLAPLGAVRTLTDIQDLSEYGLDTPQNTITLTKKDGTKEIVALGNTNSSTGDDYVMLNNEETTLYTISGDLRSSLSDNLYDYAKGEELPVLMASDIEKVDVSLDSQELSLSLEDNLWNVSKDGVALENVDQDLVSQGISQLSVLSYVDFLDYNCVSPEQYGLNPPTATLTIHYTDDTDTDASDPDMAETEETSLSSQEPDTEETSLSSQEPETEETSLSSQEPDTKEAVSSEEEEETNITEATPTKEQRELTFYIGATDASGNYYVQQKGSTEIHTMSADYIETILGWTAESFEAEPETETETEAETTAETTAETQEA